jgi:hypothetical protein
MKPVAAAVGERELISDVGGGGVGAVGVRWGERGDLDAKAVIPGRRRILAAKVKVRSVCSWSRISTSASSRKLLAVLQSAGLAQLLSH